MATARKKQIEFVKDVQETFDPVKSAQRVYGLSKSSAQGNANKKIKSKGVRELMNDSGITDKHLFDKLKKALSANRMVWSKSQEDWLEDVDWATQIKALELAMKIKGWLSPGGIGEDTGTKTINVTFNLVKARDVNEVKKLLQGSPIIKGREPVLEKLEEKAEEVEAAVEGEIDDGNGQ